MFSRSVIHPSKRSGGRGSAAAPIKLTTRHPCSFYTRLGWPKLRQLAGRLALYTLRLNSALIAFEYCLRHNGRIDLLKLSYHPDFGHYSPGNVLRFLLLDQEIKSGEARSYHMGLASDWKTRWATRLEPPSADCGSTIRSPRDGGVPRRLLDRARPPPGRPPPLRVAPAAGPVAAA